VNADRKGQYAIQERLEWRWWVTPRCLSEKPLHRWYIFPHSFTSELVHALIEEWDLGPSDIILDPFAGAGTTLLAAKEKHVPAVGYDLSPLAVFAANTKTADYNKDVFREAWLQLKIQLKPDQWNGSCDHYPDLVCKALPDRLLYAFDFVAARIRELPFELKYRDALMLALVSIIPQYSRAIATGGWLKWVKKRSTVASLPRSLASKVNVMLKDITQNIHSNAETRTEKADARVLPDLEAKYSAVITSPPYPNRHDYTRVFGVELMFAFFNWEETRQLRYQSFHSHPEARPERPEYTGYCPPGSLRKVLSILEANGSDPRIPNMLDGYFKDLYICLAEMRRVCAPKAHIALVLGNAQYSGQPVMVDEITCDIGEQVGLHCEKLIVARYRGNSAQQMGVWGKNPSRESIIVFRRE